jgi:hypothetical protein
MDTIWEKYRAFATTSLAMAQTASSVKEIATLLDITQFWVQLSERTNTFREMSVKARSA